MRLFAALVITLSALSPLAAGDWPNWRGPNLNGVAAGIGYPLTWSKTENVLWKVSLPDAGSSTPAVWKDRIFVTSPGKGRNRVLCFDRDGRKLWETALGPETPGKHNKGSGSNPSPVTDGRYVFVYFKSGEFAGLDVDGNLLWKHNLQEKYGEDTLWWDLGTSPVLTSEHVVVTCMHSGPSYLAAFDKRTGEIVWKHDRNLDAPVEAAQSYTTPVVTTENGREIIVVLGADHVTAHDTKNGKELWRVGGLNPDQNEYFRSISSPVIAEGIVVAPYARGGSLTAIRTGGRGDVTASHVLWSREGEFADVPTPIAINGRVYIFNDKGLLTCLNLKTGEVLWQNKPFRVRDRIYSSPVLAEGRIYISDPEGRTFVLDPANEGELLATNTLSEMIVATPVFVDGQILVRTEDHLYCFGN